MSILLRCECGRYFERPEAEEGGMTPCPACGRDVPVRAIVPEPEVLVIRDAAEPPTPTRRRKPIIEIAVVVLVCLVLVALLMPATRSARNSARKLQCASNLRQIGLALHNYHSVYGCLPPRAIVDKDGRPLLSWRVAILPFLEASDLYEQFHLDGPWDSPHNRLMVDKMPMTFACPSDAEHKPGTTGYLAVVGDRTAFTPDFRPLKLDDFTDGTDRTILVGESRQTVEWTKPDDLRFSTLEPLSGLGSRHGYHWNGFNVLFVDGGVRFLDSSIDPKVLEALLTRDGSEVVRMDDF